MSKRRASHAGSWYSSRRADLSAQLQSWMDRADVSCGGARAIIAPHAGYSYSGPTAAWAYRHINPEGVRRVFVLGPSHHVHLAGCALTRCIAYQTPLGELPIDQPLCAELLATGDFETMDLSVDEEEHSIEMHLPYIQQVMGDQPFTLVPILVGALSQASQSRYGEILAPFLGNAQNLIIISSDFCHWGKRFRFTHRDNACQYIYQSIEALDRQGMELIEKQASLTLPWCPYATPHFSYMPHPTFPICHRFLVFFWQDANGFSRYQHEFKNTICGQFPIAVLLQALERANQQRKHTLRFVKYDQSNKVVKASGSSVSYASAVVWCNDDGDL
jgi:AmmeMemoRadiSam system protein B